MCRCADHSEDGKRQAKRRFVQLRLRLQRMSQRLDMPQEVTSADRRRVFCRRGIR